jgi:hypothetical protein
LLIPGFGAGDLTLSPLGVRLRKLGYRMLFAGIYARDLACRFPELVERAILLGSPVKAPLKGSNTFLRPLFGWAHRRCPAGLQRRLPRKLR